MSERTSKAISPRVPHEILVCMMFFKYLQSFHYQTALASLSNKVCVSQYQPGLPWSEDQKANNLAEAKKEFSSSYNWNAPEHGSGFRCGWVQGLKWPRGSPLHSLSCSALLPSGLASFSGRQGGHQQLRAPSSSATQEKENISFLLVLGNSH